MIINTRHLNIPSNFRVSRFVVVRVITAVTLFAVLGEANVWLDTTTNTVLALGYRFGLVLLPLTLHLLGHHALVASLALMAAGTGLLSLRRALVLSVIAACLFSYGAAVSGYLIKNVAAQTKRGAANNRIAMNVGALTAGLVILSPLLNPPLFFQAAAMLVGVSVLIAAPRRLNAATIHVRIFSGQPIAIVLAWVLVGAAMGMMLFGVFSVLPQTILRSGGVLPDWYGLMIILNSAVVVVGQVPSLKLIEMAGSWRLAAIFAVIFFGFALLAVPGVFHVDTFAGAAVWVLLVSVAECSFGHIDYYSVRQNTMFIKEICIGLGAALTVGTMRSVPLPYSSMLVAGTGTLFTLAWWLLTRHRLHDFD